MMDRLPALPLVANDPYFSVWMPGDTLTDTETAHWTGAVKPLHGFITIDGRRCHWLGRDSSPAMETRSLRVTPTQTVSELEACGVRLTARFWTPALPRDLDVLSTPITFLDLTLESADGQPHQAEVVLDVSDRLCYDGEVPPAMTSFRYDLDGLHTAYIGQQQQRVLGHSGDHITIDWGYLYLASRQGAVENNPHSLTFRWQAEASAAPVTATALLGYDDIGAINYFGEICRAWYMRDGKTIVDALRAFDARHDELSAACGQLDAELMDEARAIGGEDYRLIVCAAWRHTFAAHKLIATPQGEMALLSKENDSNGCIGTVDVSYPSIPLFLRYCPELVNALCRPVLTFAALPVWDCDFAPHDVGRYPYATGQVYAARRHVPNGAVYPPFYLYPAGTDVYDFHYQMPVEECGNMLIMLEAAMAFGADESLARGCLPLLDSWVRYLDRYGEDPGDQLCTDDFAGHLSHNVNLSAKALVGIACYARIMRRFGQEEEARRWDGRARAMADSWLSRARGAQGTALTFDGSGWSMKYNLAWDLALGLGLMPAAFYREETESYLPRVNQYGLPLDSRADYTKSDWLVWTAAMAADRETFGRLIAPLARYLRTTDTRVPFSDWYDTRTGRYVAFIGRSVQGGVFMPMLTMGSRA
ncbi:MAG: glutaminase domain-containing protein [Aristaeellaceae bacterium]